MILPQFLTMPKTLKLEASMYQGNGSNGMAKHIVLRESFNFIVRRFFILSSYIFINSLVVFKDYPELSPNLFSLYQELKYITHRQVLQNTMHRYHHTP